MEVFVGDGVTDFALVQGDCLVEICQRSLTRHPTARDAGLFVNRRPRAAVFFDQADLATRTHKCRYVNGPDMRPRLVT